MGITLRDLENKGLAACAVVFTAAMLGAALCGIALFDVLIENARLPRSRAGYVTAAFWLVSVAFAWWSIARSRSSWIKAKASTSVFHLFPIIAIVISFLFQNMGSGPGPDQRPEDLSWFGLMLEITVSLFYFCYFFLGITLRGQMERAAILGFVVAAASVWWSVAHLR